MLIYDTSEWKEKTSFSTGEGTVPCKICYLAERKGKETTWFLLVSFARGNEIWVVRQLCLSPYLTRVNLCGIGDLNLAHECKASNTVQLQVGIDNGDVQVWEYPSYSRLGVLRGSALVGLLTAMEVSKMGLVAVTGSRGDVAVSRG